MAPALGRIVVPLKRSQMRSETRERHLVWLEDVLVKVRMKPTPLAEAIGFRGNHLTRWQTKGTGPLSTETIQAIVKLTGLPGPDDPALSPGSGFEEGAQIDFNTLRDRAPALYKVALALTEGRPNAHPWRLATRALEAVGYRDGDIVIVDQSAVPRRGDAVCAQIYDNEARTVFRLYEPPYLLAASQDPELRTPIPVDGTRVAIAGVITELLRQREP